MKPRLLFFVVVIVLFYIAICNGQGYNYYGYQSNQQPPNDAVLLENVKALTLEKGKMTRGRRSAPISQVQCVGGSAQGRYDLEPKIVQCVNMGKDSTGDVQWKCDADLDTSVRFGRTDVSCEGYSNPDDPYVLSGSCGLEYTLEYTDQGYNKHRGNNFYNNNYQYGTHGSGGLAKFFMIVIFAMVAYTIFRQCMAAQQPLGPNRPSGYPGGYGPYGNNPGGFPPGSGPNNGYPGYNNNNCGPSNAYPNGANTWRPGFWTGLGAGGLLGQMFRPRGYGGLGGYGGYGYNNYGSNYGYNRPFGSSYSSYGSTTSFGGSTTRSSTGFGSTRRR